MKYGVLPAIVVLLVMTNTAIAQSAGAKVHNGMLSDSVFYLTGIFNCKGLLMVPIPRIQTKADSIPVVARAVRVQRPATPAPSRTPFLKIHGNVMYDFFYQSNSDTPYVEKDLHQHTLQTTLDITVRNQYPLHLTFNTAKGNSAYFRNITGINLKYTNRDFKNLLFVKAREWGASDLKQLQELEAYKTKLDEYWKQLSALKAWFSEPATIQRIIEAREREYYKQPDKMKVPDYAYTAKQGKIPAWQDSISIPAANIKISDSSVQKLKYEYAFRKQQLDSLQLQYDKLNALYSSRRQTIGDRKQELMTVLTKSRNNKELAEGLEALNLPDSMLPKGYKAMLAIKSLGIGRSLVDYSELTVKNISVTGFQAEYNPSYYLAFATGAVDYRFRNFVVAQNRVKQYVTIVRAGIGMKEGNNLIFSYYTGKKQVYNFNTAGPDSIPLQAPDYRIMGVSLEGRWQVNRHLYFTGEAAKSSLPYYKRATDKQSVPGSMLHFNDRANEAYAVTGNAFIPGANTRINGMIKKMGAAFQSFSMYNSGSDQLAWSIKADQPFFHQQLLVTGMIRKNVFNSLLENSGYESNTIFKSIQATFRRKPWPVVTVGYSPTSQLMKLSDDTFMENMFYALNGTISHFYEYKHISMNTMFTGTRFYNRQNDTSFVYFNSTSLMLNQTVFLNRFTLSGGLSSVMNREYNLHGADAAVQYRIGWFDVGGGLKYNRQSVYNITQLGYSANMRMNVPRLGEIGLMGDRGFVPGANKRLVPNETGRLTYTKIF